MSCCPTRRIIRDCGFQVCISCGTQDTCPVFIKPHAYSRIPARAPYSRKNRFYKLLFNVWSARLPSMAHAFVKHIIEIGPNTPSEIIEVIRQSKSREYKRYDCISKLSIELLNHKVEPMDRRQVQLCMGFFQRVEIKHRAYGGVFPAYSFLLEQCFQHPLILRHDLVQYLHRLKCPRRRNRYSTIYGSCFHHDQQPISRQLQY